MWALNMDGFGYVKVEGFQWGKNFTNIHVANSPWWEKRGHQIMGSTQLSTMCGT
jgi:hypothetical protein